MENHRNQGSEELYRLLVENAQEYAIFMVDVDGCVASWNSGAERIFGYSETEAVGLHIEVLFTSEQREEGVPEAELETAAREGRAMDDRWQLRKDGTRFFASGVTESMTDDGRLRGYVKLLRDNTERKEAEQRLQHLNETLEARVDERTRQVREQEKLLAHVEQQERSRIARILHDEIQQLMHSLQFRIRMLADASDPVEATNHRAAATEALQQAIRITRSLTVQLDPPILRVEGPQQALRWLADHMREQHGLAVDLDLAEDGVDKLPQDRQVIVFHVIRELLFNVVKHAEISRAELRTEILESQLIVTVVDEGSGFDPEDSLGEHSRGYGLSTVRERIAAQGGRLEIASGPSGTTITMVVPLDP